MLGDISRSGACIVREGSLDVKPSDVAFISIIDQLLLQDIGLYATVKLINSWKDKTLAGLLFTEGPLLPGTILDQYIDRTLMMRGPLKV
jgi:hypothetical protein